MDRGREIIEAQLQANSRSAAAFLDSIQKRMPFPIKAFQVDGGSEFALCSRRNARSGRLFVLADHVDECSRFDFAPILVTAAHEITKLDRKPIVLERDDIVAGIAPTGLCKDFQFFYCSDAALMPGSFHCLWNGGMLGECTRIAAGAPQ